ncbi:MAG: DNA translocase FtsK, partial [Firmicutes bacterium]|nr:DNA translocase FtsK [Bacillota bacterium]
MISIPALFHLVTEGGIPKYADGTFINLVKYFFKDGTSLNGGVVGGLTAWGLYSAIEKGSYLALSVLVIIGIMLTTGKSLFAAVFAFFSAIRARRRVKEAKIKARAEHIKEKEAKRAKKEEEAEMKRQQKFAEIPPLKMKKGGFNITINGDEGLDNSLPALDAVVFEKKKEEPPKAEEIKEAYDFKRDAEKDWNYKEDKFIEVVGVIEENTDEDDIVFEMAEKTEEEINAIFPDKIERTFDAESIEFGGAEDGKLLEGVLNEEENFDSESIKKEIKNMPKTEAIEFADDDEEYEKYEFPPIELLGKAPYSAAGENKKEMLDNAKKLEDTLHSFGVEAKVVQINKGPTVTRYELTPSQGVKVSKIVNLSDDLALNLAATGIRIEAPIPGKSAVGIEVPNKESQSVYLRSVIESDAFKKAASKVTFALGQDIAGNPVVTDIAKMPHLLIAGATGSGKSVCINTLITSILYKADPEEVKLILIDPKVVELSVYNGIPHLLIPVVTDPKKAAGSLNWAVREMLGRYQLFAEHNVRDIKGYNEMKRGKDETDLMPQIVIVIDELADLMMAAPG